MRLLTAALVPTVLVSSLAALTSSRTTKSKRTYSYRRKRYERSLRRQLILMVIRSGWRFIQKEGPE